MDGEQTEEDSEIRLHVKRSPISGSGIARVNISILDMPGFDEGKAVMVKKGSIRKVLRLVADSMMEKDMISLRQKDMIKLGVKEGDEIVLIPFKGVGDRIGKKLRIFRK